MEPRIRAELLNQLREHAAAVDLAGLLETHGTPLLVIDPAAARTRLDELEEQLPFVDFSYAVAAEPHPAVLQALWGRTGFALSGMRELEALAAAGVPADGSILLSPVTAASDIARAYASGVRTFTLDAPLEVDKYARMPKDVGVLVRIAAGPSSSGVAPERAVNLIRYALGSGVNVSGLSIHLGASARSAVAMEAAITRSLRLIDEIERSLGVRLGTLDIGGGFPAAAAHRTTELAAICAVIRRLLVPRSADLRVVAEPGRYIAEAVALQAARVIGQADRDGELWNHLDDGVHGGYSRVLTERAEPTVFGLDEVLGETCRLYPATLAGPSGAREDVISSRQLLPPLSVGDVVVSRSFASSALDRADRTTVVVERESAPSLARSLVAA